MEDDLPDSAQALFLAIIVAPGLLGFQIFSKLYCREIEDNFEKISYIIVLNLASLAVTGLFWNIGLFSDIDFSAIKTSQIFDYLRNLFVPMLIVSSMFAGAWAFLLNSGFLQNFLRKIGATRKTGHGSVLSDVITSYPKYYFKVRFKSGGYVIGHPCKYSLHGDEDFIFLRNAARRPARLSPEREQPPEEAVEGAGILLLNFDDVLCVEVI